ncbi:transient receptor potential cation channel subfamily A member 1-like isoform X2 [Branchiostoma lanceolatum]|uniref:transient receptor potential cation channel subfamily A member 1-like isoform X2 n=1 Tax=Branchiostoma lanceolatum TaxID=7740 RepID=UPI003455178B
MASKDSDNGNFMRNFARRFSAVPNVEDQDHGEGEMCDLPLAPRLQMRRVSEPVLLGGRRGDGARIGPDQCRIDGGDSDRRITGESLKRGSAYIYENRPFYSRQMSSDSFLKVEIDPLDLVDGSSTIHESATKNDVPSLAKLLEGGHDINDKDWAGRSAVFLAVRNHSYGALDLLLRNNADTANAVAHSDDAALHYAVKGGDVRIVNDLLTLDQSCDVNVRGNGDLTPLHLAVNNNDTEMVKVLVQNNADVNAIDSTNVTPIALATSRCSPELMFHLLSPRATGPFCVRGAGEQQSNGGLRRPRSARETSKDNINNQDEMQRTPLMLAALFGDSDSLRLLLSTGADVRRVDCDGRSVLHHAVGHSKVLDVLLQNKKAKRLLEKKDGAGCTPLHHAAQGGFDKNVRSLLAAGADRNSRNDNGETALNEAARHGRLNVMKTLLRGSGREGKPGDSIKVRLVNTANSRGMRPLHLACKYGHPEVVRYLLDNHAAITQTVDGTSPLHYAVKSGNQKTVDCLLDVHYDCLNWEDDNGNTPLHVAAKENLPEIVTLLLTDGAIITENHHKENALDIAVNEGSLDAALAMGRHARWADLLRQEDRPQLPHLVVEMPTVAVEFLNRFGVEETISGGDKEGNDDKVMAYDFSYMYGRREGLSFLKAITRNRRWQCLQHPIVEKFLKVYWEKIGFRIFLATLVVYLIFLSCLTTLVMMQATTIAQKRYDTNITTEQAANCYNLKLLCDLSQTMCVLSYVVLVFAAIGLIKDVYNLIRQGLDFLTVSNLLYCIMCVAALLYALPIQITVPMHPCLKTYAAAIAVFLAWIIFVLVLRRIYVFGLYIIMIGSIFITMIRVVLVFIIYLFAFCFSFFYLVTIAKTSVGNGFDDFPRTFYTLLSMMMGELDINNNFKLGVNTRNSITLALLLIFIVVMCIIIVNLLVGLAVGDIKAIREAARLSHLQIQAEYMLHKEWGINLFLWRYQVMHYNEKKRSRKKMRWITRIVPHQLRELFDVGKEFEEAKSCSCHQILEETRATVEARLREVMSILSNVQHEVSELAKLPPTSGISQEPLSTTTQGVAPGDPFDDDEGNVDDLIDEYRRNENKLYRQHSTESDEGFRPRIGSSVSILKKLRGKSRRKVSVIEEDNEGETKEEETESYTTKL